MLATKKIAAGDRRRYVVNYRDYLPEGSYLTAATVVSSSTTSTIDSVAIVEAHKIVFFVNAGPLNEIFTATVQVTVNDTEVVHDTIQFTVAPA